MDKQTIRDFVLSEEQDGLTIRCAELKVELWEDCTGDICRTKIKSIVE